jgi:putative Mn2+ efflux pump MntP
MLLEAVTPPEEPGPSGDAELLSGAADAFLVGLSLPFLSVPLWWAVGLAEGCVLLFSALAVLLPEGLMVRLRPWVTAAGGLALTFVGMQLLLRSLV